MHTLIAGCGYVGTRLAARLHAQGDQVTGLRRTPPAPLPYLHWRAADLSQPASLESLAPVDRLVFAAGLRRDAEERYQHLFIDGLNRTIDALHSAGHPVRRVVFVSTTGVFAEREGGWVDETSPVDATHSPGRYYLAAEERLRTGPWPATIVRLAGIYGPERIRLIREVREGRARRFPPPIHWLNQLHADDAAGAIAHLLNHAAPDPLIVASDREPADRDTVLAWLAQRLDLPPPPPARPEDPRPGRRSGNKRCRSDRLVAHGYTFRYPTFREGYEALLHEP